MCNEVSKQIGEKEINGEKYKELSFAKSKLLSTYLYGFVSGDYEILENTKENHR